MAVLCSCKLLLMSTFILVLEKMQFFVNSYQRVKEKPRLCFLSSDLDATPNNKQKIQVEMT